MIHESHPNAMLPMHHAIMTGHVIVIDRLIEQGVSLTEKDSGGYTPAAYAIMNNQIEVFEHLITHYPITLPLQHYPGYSWLHIAAARNQSEIARLLIHHGAELDANSPDNETPLMLAVNEGHIDMVALLLEHGANTEATNANGDRPLHLALDLGNSDIARVLLQHHADVNARYADGQTPLFKVASDQNEACLLLLLENGADPNLADTEAHLLPIDMLVDRADNVEMVKTLLSYGATVTHTDHHGNTLLHAAVIIGCTKIIKLLLEHDCPVNIKNEYGLFPVQYLLSSQRIPSDKMIEIADAFVAKGSDLNAADQQGYTLLHEAAVKFYPEFISYLCQHGLNVNAKTQLQLTPLHYAINSPNPRTQPLLAETVRVLVANGADIYTTINHHYTPLQYAVQHNLPIANILAPLYSDTALENIYTSLNEAQHSNEYQTVVVELAKRRWSTTQNQPEFLKRLRLANVGLFGTCRSPRDSTRLPEDIQLSIARHHLENDYHCAKRFVRLRNISSTSPVTLKRQYGASAP